MSSKTAPTISALETTPTTSKSHLDVAKPWTQRSHREKSQKTAPAPKSSIGDDASEKSMQYQKVMEDAKVKVMMWDREEMPPRSIISDEDISEISSVTELQTITTGRPSIIHTSNRRARVEMDAANKLANEMLQKAKDALESATTMKKESKQTTIECLQTLYETVLALSDSRSRHKYNLEKERLRNAHDLVRIERAHNKKISQMMNDLSHELGQARKDIHVNLEETKSIRGWLGYETQEPYKQIGEIGRTVGELEKLIRQMGKITLNTSQEGKDADTIKSLKKDCASLANGVDKISLQLDELRRRLDKINTGTDLIQVSSTEILEKIKNSPHPEYQAETSSTNLPVGGLEVIKEEIREMANKINHTLAAHTPNLPSNMLQKTELKEELEPITERLEAVSSELRTMREQKQRTPPKAVSIEEEIAIAESKKPVYRTKPTYAQAVTRPQILQPNHTLIVSSTDANKTGEKVIESIREVLNLKKTGFKLDRVRKGKNQKIILSCSSKNDMSLVQTHINCNKNLKAEVAKTNNPLAKIKDVLSYHTDAEIVEHILAQNQHLLQGIDMKDSTIKIRYRKRARNPLECHPVLELSPEIHKKFIEAGKIYIGLQRRPIVDQSPLVQCIKCLGFGHTRAVCKEQEDLCSHCGGEHSWDKCARRSEGKSPTCKNCSRAKRLDTNLSHNAFSDECPERQKWDVIARSRVSYC